MVASLHRAGSWRFNSLATITKNWGLNHGHTGKNMKSSRYQSSSPNPGRHEMGLKDCTVLFCLLNWTCLKQAAIILYILLCGNSVTKCLREQFNTALLFKGKSPGAAGFLALVRLPSGTEVSSTWICSSYWDTVMIKSTMYVISLNAFSWGIFPYSLSMQPPGSCHLCAT